MGLLANEEKGDPGFCQGYLSKVQTLPSLLREEGYSNCMVGKWHLGLEKENWTLEYGFAKYFDLLRGASIYFELIENQSKERLMVN